MALNKALKAAGIVPVCDIVINHRCADQQDEHGVWNRFGRAAGLTCFGSVAPRMFMRDRIKY